MRKKRRIQLSVLGCIFFVTLILVYLPGSSHVTQKNNRLQDVLNTIEGYQTITESEVNKDIITTLSLDDFASFGYLKNNMEIGLFIGYYLNLQTLSEAHSPLVCFPAQGWQIRSTSRRSLKLGDTTLNYNEMIAGHNGQRQLVYFWYQAYDTTASEGYKNKLNALLNKITKNKQEHAFVRLALPLQKISKTNARQLANEFLQAFYPQYLNYIYSE